MGNDDGEEGCDAPSVTKTMVIAQKLNRSYAATRKKASTLGVMLGGGRGKKGV
jgi:hypothetical protein